MRGFFLIFLGAAVAQAAPLECPRQFKEILQSVSQSPAVIAVTEAALPHWNRFRDKTFTVYMQGKAYSDVAFSYLLPYRTVAPLTPGARWYKQLGEGSASFGRGVYNDGLRFLSPVPLPKAQHPVNQIFEKLWNNPLFEPSAEDIALLNKYKALENFTERQKFYQTHANWRTAHRALAFGFGGVIVASTSIAVAQGAMMASNSYAASDFLNLPSEGTDGVPVVQVLIETVPFPHTSIRIADTVYSYGFTHVTAEPVSAYFANMIAGNPQEVVEKELPVVDGDADDSSSAYLGLARIQRSLGKHLKRSLRIVELKLSLEEVKALRKDLESQVGKRYANKTLVNDCSSMVMRALDRNSDIHIPNWVDPYPSVSAAVLSAYLGMRSLLGDTQVGKTMMVVPDGTSSNLGYAVRNTLIGALEGRVLINTAIFPAGVVERNYMDIFESDADREYYDPEVAAVLKEWRVEAARSLREELINYYGDADIFVKIGKMPADDPASKAKRGQARDVINQQIDAKEQEINETLDSAYVTLRDLEESSVKLTVLEQVRHLWLKQIGD